MSSRKVVAPNSRPFVIGTSGHIDHGKTTLVKALTGVDTDRWVEEKKRGITIDLGFAHYEDEQGNQVAFVDVPGHEKFIHNMLAGAAGMDAVLLVVAVDEGVMPQTREHLNICNLLKIQTGVVALTRIDLVENPEMMELCQEEVSELLVGTFLEGTSVIPVSTVTGEGLDELREALLKLPKQIQNPETEKPFRLNVDRSFTVKGFGTVVTGTVLCGTLSQDEEIQQFPQHRSVRIRGLQAHGQGVKLVHAGQRAALNLAGITKEKIQRGDQLAKPESLLTSYMLNASLTLLEDVSAPLKNRTRVRLHLGSREVFGRIVLLEGESLSPGKTTLVQFRSESLLSGRYGDRFIVRSYSPMFTLGGGVVVDPSPSKSRRVLQELPERLRRLYAGDENVRSEEVIYLQSVRGVVESEFSVRSGLSTKQSGKVLQLLQSQKKILCVESITRRYLHIEHVERIGNFLGKVLGKHHKKFPDREGMTSSELGGKLSLIFSGKEVESLLKYLLKVGALLQNNQYFSLVEHQQQVSQSQEDSLAYCLKLIRSGGFQPLRRTHLLEELGLNEKDGVAMLKSAVHSKQLVRVADDLHYDPEQIETILESLRIYLDENQNITVIQFKELLNISRKHAIDLLEYFDSQRLTIREENHRIPAKIIATNA
ncbi:MAG: selenocysteine-specific translation elongation factor [SAR324 cluster bacterium]|nr:selenocysteine-specific translation elongation factor [SAR324 cluster bacterium]